MQGVSYIRIYNGYLLSVEGYTQNVALSGCLYVDLAVTI
jgi:hypothetical protein